MSVFARAGSRERREKRICRGSKDRLPANFPSADKEAGRERQHSDLDLDRWLR